MTDTTSKTPWRRGTAEVAAGLQRWAEAWSGSRSAVSDVRQPENGMANETILFRVDGRPLVARLAPLATAPFPTFPDYDLEFQRRCMELVRHHTDVPVPAVVHLESSDEWLGAPFLVLAAVDGVVPTDNPPYVFDGWLLEAEPGQRRKLEERSVAVLAALHAVTPDRADLSFLEPQAPGASNLERLLGVQRRYYEWAREGQSIPLVEEAFDVLTATAPSPERVALSWGDSRIGNILYRDFEPVAVLDWEMATLAPPEVDLGWMTSMHANFQSFADAYGLPGLPDFLQRDHVVASYERHAGHHLLDLAWFEAFAALRMAIISIRTSLRGVAFGQQPPPAEPDDLITFHAVLRKAIDEVR